MITDVAGHISLALERTRNLNGKVGDLYLRPHQIFTSKIFLGLKTLTRLLLFWDTGTGKTLTSVYIIKHLDILYPDWKVFIFVKASLHHDPWVSTIERCCPNKLNSITIFHYDDKNVFHNFSKKLREIDLERTRLLFIVDECHNFISRSIPTYKNKNRPSEHVYNIIKRLTIKRNKLLIVSATPILNEVDEFQYLTGLLRNGTINVSDNQFFNNTLLGESHLISKLAGACSYYRLYDVDAFEDTERSDLFPSKRVIYKNITMTEYQSKIYDIREKEELKKRSMGRLRLKRKLAATLVFGDEEFNIEERYGELVKLLSDIKFSNEFLKSFIDDTLIDYFTNPNNKKEEENYNMLNSYSCKYIEACRIILQSKGKCAIYEPFVTFEGIATLILYLDCFDITYITYSKNSKERNTNVIKFNDEMNIDGSDIKVCIFSNAGSEGITLLEVNDVIVLDIPWTDTMMRQLMGRTIRLNSHKRLDISRQYVNIFLLIASTNRGSSVDREILEILKRKSNEISILYEVLRKSSIESINKAHPDEISKDEYIFKTLDQMEVRLTEQIGILELKKLVKIYYTSDDFKTIMTGYLDKTSNIVYNNSKKVGIIDQDIFEIVEDILVYPLNNSIKYIS